MKKCATHKTTKNSFYKADLAAARGREAKLARLVGCLEPGEDGRPSCDKDHPCIACAAIAATKE